MRCVILVVLLFFLGTHQGNFLKKSKNNKNNQKKRKKYSIFSNKFRLNICGVKCLNTQYDEVRWGKSIILNHLRPKKGLTSRP
jgi:hypothetical protein